MMVKSVRTTTPQFEKQKVARFRRLDNNHISAIESLFQKFQYLNERVEIHMPYHKAKSTFGSEKVWVWPKFDKRPVGYLIFLEDFAPCIWYPERQEGLTFRWLLPPNFLSKGPVVCLANILAGESVLQIEDIIIYEGKDLWSHKKFSERWDLLNEFWNKLPSEQPLLAFKPRVVTPVCLEDWESIYDPTQYWIFQPNHSRAPRWFWKDTITPIKETVFIPPTLKRCPEILNITVALCRPYTSSLLPDTYSLYSQEEENLGIASVLTLELSQKLRDIILKHPEGIPVEVKWNNDFLKYQIVKIVDMNTPISSSSFFVNRNV
jgi:hypothetical protein